MSDIKQVKLVKEQKGVSDQKDKLKKLERDAALVKCLPHLFGKKLYQFQRDVLDSKNKVTLLCSANQIGKAIYNQEFIPTTTGMVRMEDISVGDMVFGPDGKPAKVIAIPYVGEQQSYKVTFDDGSTVICGENHLWTGSYGKRRFNSKTEQTIKTSDIIKLCKYSPTTNPARKFKIRCASAVEYKEAKPVFDPYLIGLIIGDGCTVGQMCQMCTADDEIREYIESKYDTGSNGMTIRIKGHIGKAVMGIVGKKYSYEKRIPEDYLTSSIEDRKKILAGLIDTDGSCTESGVMSYCTTSEKLKDDFCILVSSLGGLVGRIQERYTHYTSHGELKTGRKSYVIYFKTLFNPFRLTRKRARYKLNARYDHCKLINYIESVGVLPTKCITVDREDGLFLAGNGFTVTHNSSIGIIRCIKWATTPSMWPSLWRSTPNVFWYMYPDYDTVTAEFEEKWVKEFLPSGEMKDHKIYGWKEIRDGKKIKGIRFNSGITVYFKTYGKDVMTLQSATVHAIFCDEELPVHLYPEVMARLSGVRVDGYFTMVFTATIGQDFWRRAIEPKEGEDVSLPDAKTVQVSLFDAMYYEDGTKSDWTEERIERIKRNCLTWNEVLKRVYGKFVKDTGLKYPTFERVRHLRNPWQIPANWLRVGVVDCGSGGPNNHPAAISFFAVSPDYKRAIAYRCWRGDKIVTTAGDILEKFRELSYGEKIDIKVYDWGAVDFGILAINDGFIKAEKSHERGEAMLNTLFKRDMLVIGMYDDSEYEKAAIEFETLFKDVDKRKCKDDLVDTFRYFVTAIPFDISGDSPTPAPKRIETYEEMVDRQRSGKLTQDETDSLLLNEDPDFDDYNNLMEDE